MFLNKLAKAAKNPIYFFFPFLISPFVAWPNFETRAWCQVPSLKDMSAKNTDQESWQKVLWSKPVRNRVVTFYKGNWLIVIPGNSTVPEQSWEHGSNVTYAV